MENFFKKKNKRIAIFFDAWYNKEVMEREKIETLYRDVILGEKKEEFALFRALLLEYNQKYNLTTILEEKDMYYKHFLDSAIGLDLFKKNSKVAEIGSGAGFPSLVLKIIRPDLQFDLFESVGKKCEFLQVVVDNLHLQGVHIYNLRAEEATRKEKFREKYDHATARAVARMNSLSEYCLPFVKVGGTFIAYKSGEIEEIFEAESAYKLLGGKKIGVFDYELPEGYGKRVLAEIEKIQSTPSKYPRGQGKERKQPL